MSKQYQNTLQNFSAGEVTPRMSMRVDSQAFENALSASKNFIISSQGGAVFREGFQHIGYAPSAQPFRLFQFHRGGDESDILIEVAEGVIRYWIDDQQDNEPYLAVDLVTILSDEDDGELLTDEDDGEFLSVGTIVGINPYSLDDLDGLYFSNQDKYGVLVHPNHPPIYITIERNGTIVTQQFPKERIPQFAYRDSNNPGYVAESASWTISFPDSWAGKSFLYYLTYDGVQAVDAVSGMGQVFAFTGVPATNVTNIQNALNAAAARQGYATSFVVASVDALTYTVTVSGDNSGWRVDAHTGYWPYYLPYGGFWNDVVRTVGSAISESPVVQPGFTGDAVEEPAWSYPTYVLHNSVYYRCTAVHRSAAANEPGVGAEWELYWEDVGVAKPVGFDYQFPSGNAWASGQTYAPGGRGFPTVVVFHDQRLLFMANPDNPTALYGSGLGYYFNFAPGANDDEPIKWARSQATLTLGTSSGEWRISADVTLTPTDIQAQQQNNARSERAIPAQVDTEIFYIEQGGRKLRATRYFDESNSLTSSDVSLLAEHLIATNGIKRIAVSYIPEVFMAIVRNNGQPVFFTYEKNQPVLAFTDQQTDGFVYDCASYFAANTNRDYTYFAVERNGNYVLERMRYPCSKVCAGLTENKVVHMDGWVRGTVAGSVITGLGHLEGKEVWVLIDDAWQIGEFIVEAGQIELSEDKTGALYAVGLPMTGEITTFEKGDNADQTGLGTRRRWNRLTTRLLNSAKPRILTRRGSDRTPSTPMGISENIIEGIHNEQQNNAGFNDGSLTVIVDRPYPCHILGFYGKYQVGDD